MKKIYISIAVSMVVLAILSSCATGRRAKHSTSPVLDRVIERDELVVGTAASMPPFNLRNAAGEIIGFEIDIAQYFYNALGVSLKLETMPFAEPLTYEPIGVALPSDDPLLVNWVENRLTMLEGSGLMEELQTYWFGGGS